MLAGLLTKRVYLYFLVFYLLFFIILFSTRSGLTDRGGHPVGRDFSHYWTAASLALSGEPAEVYDFPRLQAAGEPIFGPGTALPWLYPPTFLLIILPLALLPYLVALALWIIPALIGYLWILRRLAPHPLTLWLTLAFPGTYQNILFGQNGFLSAILLGGGILLLGRFPLAAGVLLGLLSYKPHLMVLVVLALAAGRYWRALLSTLFVTAALAAASVLVLGTGVWIAFLNSTPEAVKTLQAGLLPWSKVPLHLFNMPTVFCALLEAGASAIHRPDHARCGDAGGGRRGRMGLVQRAPLAIRGSLLVIGILLFTPYAAIYDLVLMALPLAWLSWDGHTRGWLRGEPPLLVLAWLIPLVAPLLALATNLQLAPLLLILLAMLALRRWFKLSPADIR